MSIRNLITAITFSGLGMTAMAQNPYASPDETWLSLSGTVVSAREDSFRLDYGDGIVTVEMDDRDAFSEARQLEDGDRVTVYGVVDDDLYEVTSIEANSIYAENLNTYFFANSADEEETMRWITGVPIKLSEVSPLLGSFTIGKGNKAMEVDVSPLPYDPLDQEGYQRIEKGDRVSVNGFVTEDFFTGQELNAESVVTLREGPV